MNLLVLGSWTWLWETINGLFLILCDFLYRLIGLLYQVFDAVARTNLFSEDIFNQITSRIYVVMGIAMLFIFAYNIILMIVNPEDKKSIGNTSKAVKETIISLVLIVLLPTIFNYLYIFQNHVLSSNIIGQIILGTTYKTGGNCDPDDYDCTCDFEGYGLDSYTTHDTWNLGLLGLPFIGGSISGSVDIQGTLEKACVHYREGDDMTDSKRGAYSIAPMLMQAFYRPTHFTYDECVQYLQGDTSLITDDEDKNICVNYFFDVNAARYSGDVSAFVRDSYLKNVVSDSDKNNLEFDWLLAVVAGVLAVYMFFCYAMEIGVRVAKLGVLQLISPIPVMMRIVPKQKEGIYDKWFKQLRTTYLDVFIRLMIIYFALFAISLVPEVIEKLFASLSVSSPNPFVQVLAVVFVVLGILKFGQDAPGLLKDLFGGMGGGSFALRSPKKQLTDNKALMGGLGAVGTLRNRALNHVGNYKRIMQDDKKTNVDKFKAYGKNTLSMLNPFANAKAAQTGYDATKDGKNILDGINRATAENLSDRGAIYKAKKAGKEYFEQGKHYFNADYINLNVDKLEQEIKALEDLVKYRKELMDQIGEDKNIKRITSYYDEQIKKAAESGDYKKQTALEDAKKADIEQLRNAIMQEKRTGHSTIIEQQKDGRFVSTNASEVDTSKIDEKFTAAFDKYSKELNNNFSTIKDVLEEQNVNLGSGIENNLASVQEAIDKNSFDVIDKIGKAAEKRVSSDKTMISDIQALRQGKKDK